MTAVQQEEWPSSPAGIPAHAVYEGSFAYWIEGNASSYRIMCGGAGDHFEVQRNKSWYPDEIYKREQRMLAKSQQKP